MTNFSTGHRGWISTALLARFTADETDAHRLCTAHGGWVERLGDDVLISYASEPAREDFLSGLAAWRPAEDSTGGSSGNSSPAKMPSAWRRCSSAATARSRRPAWSAKTASATAPISRPATRRGSFIDQRHNRLFLRSRPRTPAQYLRLHRLLLGGRRAGGRGDRQPRSLPQIAPPRGGKLPPERPRPGAHSFLADDVLEVLPRLSRRGEKFDAIVLDPPTFSRGEKGRRFQVEHDFEALLPRPWKSPARTRACSFHQLRQADPPALETIARFCLKLVRRQASFHAEPDLPDIPGALPHAPSGCCCVSALYQQLDLKNQRLVRPDVAAGAALPVRQIGGDIEHPLAPSFMSCSASVHPGITRFTGNSAGSSRL